MTDLEFAEIAAQRLVERLTKVRKEAGRLALEQAARWQERECAKAFGEGRQEAAELHASIAGGLHKMAAADQYRA